MDSHEDYLDALTAYSRNPTGEIPPILDQYLNGVAKNGETLFQWPLLKPLVVGKTEQVIGELQQGLCSENIPQRPNVENVRFDVMHSRIMDALQKFNGAPFTIQRLCELLVDPKRHYKRSDKFMRGLEKNVLVVSTVDPFGRKVVSESGSKHLVNGMDTNGSPFFPRDTNITSNLPPVPGWVTSTVASREPNTSASDSSEQRQEVQTSSQDSALTANGVGENMVSSVYTDQGEQPLAVHGEEVVEETVVTMDTNEVGPVVSTDGGEGMAVDEEEEEEMGGEDTNASSSSSSSSSSEELATVDTSENAGPASSKIHTPGTSTTGESRPWASIANEGENKKSKERILPSSAADSPNKIEDISSDSSSSSQSPPSRHSDSPLLTSSTDTTTSATKPTSDEQSVPDKGPGKSESDEEIINSTTHHQSLDKSLGFSPSGKSTSEESQKEDMVSTSTPSTDNSTALVSSGGSSPSVITSTAISKTPQVSGDHIRTYAEVLASSHVESASRNIPPMETSEECDSVAGLERLVDSVEPSSSPLLPALSSLQSSLQSPPKVNPNTSQSESPSSSPSTSIVETEEPPVKRSRSSPSPPVSEPVSSQSNPDIPPQSEPEVASPSTTNTTTESDSVSNPESSNFTVSSSAATTIQNCESLDLSVSSKNEESQSAKPSTEQEGEDSSPPDHGNVSSSPSSQLASSSDSMGFEMCGDNASKTSDKCLNEKDSASQEVESSDTAASATQETANDTEDNHEPMDQQ